MASGIVRIVLDAHIRGDLSIVYLRVELLYWLRVYKPELRVCYDFHHFHNLIVVWS